MTINDVPYADTLVQHIQKIVQFSLQEDIDSGDISSELIAAEKQCHAQVITRETAIFCGRAWVEETFSQFDNSVTLTWFVDDGDPIEPNQVLLELTGSARSILTAERCALNFMQLLSSTATTAHQFVQKMANKQITILDTRKTIPGLRLAQKYAARVGGCQNHRLGLYDMFLIKENHITACGGITQAINKARSLYPQCKVEVEVENRSELEEAIAAKPDVIMLDNFYDTQGLSIDRQQTKLEASGNLTLDSQLDPNIDVDFISSGQITKHVQAIDLSLRILK